MGLFSSKGMVGIEVNGNGIWLAVVQSQRNSLYVERLSFVSALSEESEAVRRALADHVEEYQLAGRVAGIVLHDPRILHRAFILPRMSLKEVHAVIPFEAQKEFEVRQDYRIVYDVNTHFKLEGIPKIEVIAAAVPKDLVDDAIILMEYAGLIPCYLATIPFVQRFAPSRVSFSEEEKTVGRLHVTRAGVDLSIYCGKRFMFSRMIKKDLDFAQFEKLQASGDVSTLQPTPLPAGPEMQITTTAEEIEEDPHDPLERLCVEIKRSFLYVKQQSKEVVETIQLSGEGGRNPYFRESLQSALGIPLTVMEGLPEIELNRSLALTDQGAAEYDFPIGVTRYPSVFSTGNLLPMRRQIRWKKRSIRRFAKIAYAAAVVLILFLSMQLEWEMHRCKMEYSNLQSRSKQVTERLEASREMIRAHADGLLKKAVYDGLAPKTTLPEDLLAALSLDTPDSIVFDELTVKGGSQPFSMKLTGMMVLQDFASGEGVLDDFLRRCKSSGLFRMVRGRLGGGADQGESGQIRMASGSLRKIKLELLGE